MLTHEMTFSERINKRLHLWWRNPQYLAEVRPRHLPGLLQRLDQRYIAVKSSQSESRWQRGEYWQRRLVHKLNGREFAKKLGCDVPKLYWQRRLITPSAILSLPAEFVIKPTKGSGRKGVYVMSGCREMLSGECFTVGELYARLVARRGRLSSNTILAEEFIKDEKGRCTLPVEYKVHVFGDTVAAVQVILRSSASGSGATHRFYSSDWEPFSDQMNTGIYQGPTIEPPNCWKQLLSDARKLGNAWGTYVRVDMYASERGPVFGEYSSIPAEGNFFTPFADEYFGSIWARECPTQL